MVGEKPLLALSQTPPSPQPLPGWLQTSLLSSAGLVTSNSRCDHVGCSFCFLCMMSSTWGFVSLGFLGLDLAWSTLAVCWFVKVLPSLCGRSTPRSDHLVPADIPALNSLLTALPSLSTVFLALYSSSASLWLLLLFELVSSGTLGTVGLRPPPCWSTSTCSSFCRGLRFRPNVPRIPGGWLCHLPARV